jgi:CRISPR-associated endonuclease/helicase Cas3
MARWFAHSHPNMPSERWHTLRDHLLSVGEQEAQAAGKFGAAEMGQAAGLLHDLGKYSRAFQERLQGRSGRVDHSTAGAKIALERFGPLGRLIACTIAGHHAGRRTAQAGASGLLSKTGFRFASAPTCPRSTGLGKTRSPCPSA